MGTSRPGSVKRPLMRPTSSLHLGAELPVLADLAPARDGDLDERDPAPRAPAASRAAARSRGAAPGSPSCSRAGRRRGGADAARTAPAGRRAPRSTAGLVRAAGDVGGVDRDRVRGRADDAAVVQSHDRPVHAHVVEQLRARAQEVAAVPLRVEGDDVGAEHPLEHARPATGAARRSRAAGRGCGGRTRSGRATPARAGAPGSRSRW